jgi:hypothetical protein
MVERHSIDTGWQHRRQMQGNTYWSRVTTHFASHDGYRRFVSAVRLGVLQRRNKGRAGRIKGKGVKRFEAGDGGTL